MYLWKILGNHIGFSPLLVDGGGSHSASPDDGLVKVREGSLFLSCHPLYTRVSLLP